MSRRAYKSENIIVYFEPRLCIHSGYCLVGLREVFDRNRKPWIRPERADVEKVAEVVKRCPTGALHYERLDGGDEESPDAKMSVTVVPNGPLYLRGDIVVRDTKGSEIRRDTRTALCRCGRSGNKPFCDGTHTSINFDG